MEFFSGYRIIVRSVILILIILSSGFKISFAQQIPFAPRENVLFATLNQLQAREEAIRNSMAEAQMQLIESGFIRKKAEGFSLRDLASLAHPYLSSTVTFDDNIDSVPESVKKKSEFTYTNKPGVKMNFGGRGKTLNLDMYLDITSHQHRSISNSQTATINLLSNFAIERYTLAISNTASSNHLSSSELGVKMDALQYYWQNTFNSTLSRSFNRIGFNLGYKNIYYDYEPDFSLGQDRSEETFSFNQYLRIATKTQALFEYNYGRVVYDHNPYPSQDYFYNDYNLSLTGVLSPKVTGLIKIAQKLQNYKEGSDYETRTFTSTLGYRISERTNLALTLKRTINRYATKPSNYIDDNFNLTGNHRLAFNPKFNLSFGYEADYQDYYKRIGFAKELNTYTRTLGLSYAFRDWLDFSLTYTRKKTYSNVDDDYHKNTIAFTTQAKF